MNMTFVNEVARKLGVTSAASEATVLAALDQVLAEQVAEVTVTTEVTYPDGVEVVPTGTTTVAPTGTVPTGLVFSMDTVPDGWTAEVNETTGEVTVTAPDGAAVDDTADLVVAISGGTGDPATVTITATVVAAGGNSEGTSSPTTPADPAADPNRAAAGLTTVVDCARLAEPEELAEFARQAKADQRQAQARAFAAQAKADGKIGAAAVDRWARAWLADREDAENRMAAIATNTVHRSESGHAKAKVEDARDANGFTEREAKIAAALHGRKG